MPSVRLRLCTVALIVILLEVSFGWQALPHAQAQASTIDRVYFSQTGHHLSNEFGFLDFWRSRGRLLLFGYPLTEAYESNGRIVQYFERARFEYDFSTGQIQLGLLGRELLGDRWFDPAQPLADALFFPETGHNITGKFRNFWEKRGGAEVFGLPLSEALEENGRLVQYFERAHFTFIPEAMPEYYRNAERRHGILLANLHEIELADYGRRSMAIQQIPEQPVERLADVPQWSQNLWPLRIEINLANQQLRAYEGELMVYQAPVTTGRDDFRTPAGRYNVYRKVQLQTMRGSMRGETWNVPNVPWVMYFTGAVALHGTYWHNKFGTGARLSHGCVNLNIDDAEWIYQWASVGTEVIVVNQ
jgi:hypothetical protein